MRIPSSQSDHSGARSGVDQNCRGSSYHDCPKESSRHRQYPHHYSVAHYCPCWCIKARVKRTEKPWKLPCVAREQTRRGQFKTQPESVPYVEMITARVTIMLPPLISADAVSASGRSVLLVPIVATALCVNNSETSTPSTITVGAEKEFSPS